MSSKSKKGVCPLCDRVTYFTFHHFIPRKVHRRAYFKKHYTKSELQEGISICRQCHVGIHKRYDEMQLAKQFASLEALRADEELRVYFEWVSRQRIAL